MRYTEEDLKENGGKVVFGRVAEYSAKKGFGHIYAENRKDVFLSSYALGKLEKRIAIGSTVKFVPELIEGKVCATQIEVVDLFPEGRTFPLPFRKTVYIRDVQKFGLVSGESVLKEIGMSKEEFLESGGNVEDLKYVYIIVKNVEQKFFDKKVPTNKTKIDVEKYFKFLCNKFIYIN